MTPQQFLNRYHKDADAYVDDNNTIVINYGNNANGHIQVRTYHLITSQALKKYNYKINRNCNN